MRRYGKAIRKLRIDRGLRLFEMAKKMGLSSAFVSSVETGRKPLPDNFINKVIDALQLTDIESKELRKQVKLDQKLIPLDGLSDDHQGLLVEFADNIDRLPDDVIAKVRDALFQQSETES